MPSEGARPSASWARRVPRRAVGRLHRAVAAASRPDIRPGWDRDALREDATTLHAPGLPVRHHRRLLGDPGDGRVLAGPRLEPDHAVHRLLRHGHRPALVRAASPGGSRRGPARPRRSLGGSPRGAGVRPVGRDPAARLAVRRDRGPARQRPGVRGPDRGRAARGRGRLPAPGPRVPRGRSPWAHGGLRPAARLPGRQRRAAVELRRASRGARRPTGRSASATRSAPSAPFRRCSGSASRGCGSTPTAMPTSPARSTPSSRRRRRTPGVARRPVPLLRPPRLPRVVGSHRCRAPCGGHPCARCRAPSGRLTA